MIYYDLHCDTLYEMDKRALSFDNESLHVTKKKASAFSEYGQVFAVWSDKRKSDGDCMTAFRRMYALYEKEILPLASPSFRPYLAVEDARLLEGKIERLEELYQSGVRLMTLTWKGESCMGGAYDTERGLTDFGKAVVEEMLKHGMVPDLSHASDQTTLDALGIAERLGGKVVATHSNARDLFGHPRNLPDALFQRILETGGVVGISLAPQHLAEYADLSSVLRHIEHDLEKGGENALCFGCDFDGVDTLPKGIASLADIPSIADALPFGDIINQKILSRNAKAFLESTYDSW